MSRAAMLPPRGGTVLPRTPLRMRSRLLLVLALAAAGAAILVLRGLEPAAPRDRAVEIPRPAAPAEEAAPAAPAAEAKRPALRVSVRDEEGLPVEGARCAVDPWGVSGRTDDQGLASIPVPTGARTSVSVRASKDGYRPATKRDRFVEGLAMKLRLLKAPEIRVLDQAGKRITGFSWEPEGADLRERKLRAAGYLDLDLAELPREVLSGWDDLLARTPVDVFLVSDEGLGRAVVRVDRPAGVPAAVAIDTTRAKLPDLAPRLGALPHGWGNYYAGRWTHLGRNPRRTVDAIDAMRVYAEGTVVVTCLAADCRPLRQEIQVAPGRTVERTLVLEPEMWASQAIVVTDRFGRQGSVTVEILEPVHLPLAAEAPAVRVPRGGPYTLRADGGARGRAVQTVAMLPAKEPIRFELTGIEVHLKLLDDEALEPIEGLALTLDGKPVEWNADEGAYVFGPVDPGAVRLVHDEQRTVDLRVDPAEADKGVLRKEVRVRGFPGGGD